MKRFQRNYGRPFKRDERDQRIADSGRDKIEEVLPKKKIMTNRCCSVSPTRKDKGQVTEPEDEYEYGNPIFKEYDVDPTVTDAIKQLKGLRQFRGGMTKSEKSCQYREPKEHVSYMQSTEAHWQNVDTIADVDHIMMKGDKVHRKIKTDKSFLKNIHITETPRIKVIAEKFLKLKKDNVELRKLDEKIVCVEYDVFHDERAEEPVQKMRAYFSVKPGKDAKADNSMAVLPLLIQNHFQMTSDDLSEINNKEIEIIDSKTMENKTYLDDLNKVLKRKRVINSNKRKSSLDLKSLYKIAVNEAQILDESYSNINLLSKSALKEIKHQILNKSSSHEISRRIFKGGKNIMKSEKHSNITERLFAELTKKE